MGSRRFSEAVELYRSPRAVAEVVQRSERAPDIRFLKIEDDVDVCCEPNVPVCDHGKTANNEVPHPGLVERNDD